MYVVDFVVNIKLAAVGTAVYVRSACVETRGRKCRDRRSRGLVMSFGEDWCPVGLVASFGALGKGPNLCERLGRTETARLWLRSLDWSASGISGAVHT